MASRRRGAIYTQVTETVNFAWECLMGRELQCKLDSSGSGCGLMAGCYEYEHFRSIKGGKYLE